jgi:energy-coupling factor transporter ATP-binding protein EcfA2
MEFRIKNCNSIDEAVVSIEVGRLNIKYGTNGTGKSTIALAVAFGSNPDADLSQLTPFKHRSGDPMASHKPSIEGAEQFSNVAVFNEEYVNKFVFQQDEVLKNSFDIFIRSSEYEIKMAQIEALVNEIRETFNKNKQVDEIIKDLGDLSDGFGKSQSGLSKASKIGKGIGNGNKIEHIPEALEPYTSFIKSENSVKWIKWQIEGNAFLDTSTDCPYCTSPTEDKKNIILAVGHEYDAKSIEHLIAIKSIIERLGKYLEIETLEKVKSIINNKDGLKKEETSYLLCLKNEIDTLKEKLSDAKSISFFSLRDVEQVNSYISGLQIDLGLLASMNSPDTKAIVDEINKSLDSIGARAGILQGEINKQKRSIEKAISKYKREINTFLRYAGYKYEINIQDEANSYKMKLKHIDFPDNIDNGAFHLSYGERNAFSVILFMYECLTKNPDLVVLDDPISSFDKNKKFAILEMLFRGKESLQGKTILMLTHDIEPIIDLIKSLNHTFQPSPVAAFLKSRSGIIEEIQITKADVSSFAQICNENISCSADDVIKIIYLRRHYEIIDSKGLEYNLLSNLLHKRAQPVIRIDGNEIPMTLEQIDNATTIIAERIQLFDYQVILDKVNNRETMIAAYKAAQNNYEKLQLYRIINNENHESDVVKKFINESFHIENEYIMQLNPRKYDFIPEHIVAECDNSLCII